LQAMTSLQSPSTSMSRWQRRLLPAELLEEADGRRSPRDWVVDIVVLLAAIGIGVAGLVETWPDHSTAIAVVDIVVGSAVCLALWVRRRHPVAVALAAVSLAAFFAMAGGVAIIAVFNAAVRASRRALLAIVALALLSFPTFALLYPSAGSFEAQVILGVLLLAVAIGWGLFARARREVVVSLRERADRLEAEQRLRVEQAREAERRRIAREMHDVLAHRISLLSVHAGALEFRHDASPEEVAEAAGVIRATAQSALEELRDVIGVLRDDGDEAVLQPPQPTLAQIPELVEDSRAAGMRVQLHDEVADADALPVALGRTAYRAVQEGLTNARKHAPAAAVEVRLDSGPPLTVEVISRRAVGSSTVDSLPGTGTGLVGLAERVALAGGELEYGPDANGDFVLRATLPWSP
jgi:signal transduction histidine kinase